MIVDASPVVETLKNIMSAMTDPDFSPALQAWIPDLAETWTDGFVSSRAPDGSTWKPLKRARPKGHNTARRPLIDTGEMFRSAVSDGANHIEQVTKNTAEIGTSDRKAAFHQYGTKHIPARPFIGVSEKADTMLENRVSDHIQTIIRGVIQ